MSRITKHSILSSSEEPLINLTPLIDVVFVVLITFILIAPLLELDRIELAPKASNSPIEGQQLQKSPIHIYVYEDNSIAINQTTIDPSKLGEILKKYYSEYPNEIPKLFHHRRAYFGTYQKIRDEVESSGFNQLDVILKPG